MPYVKDQKTVVQYYQAADLYLHGAKIDTFPNVILEAMACGLPVVATDVGGISEQIIVNETGYLCKAGDAFEMAEHASQIIDDIELQKRLSECAVKTINNKYTLKKQVMAYLDLYEHALNKKVESPNTMAA